MFEKFTFQSEVPTKQGLLTTATYGLVYNELKYAFSCYSALFISESHKFTLSRQSVLLTCTTSDSNSYSYAMLQSVSRTTHLYRLRKPCEWQWGVPQLHNILLS